MRIVGAVLVLLLASLPATAQYDTTTSQGGTATKPSGHTHNWHAHKLRHSAVRTVMRAKRAAAARRAQGGSDSAGSDGTPRGFAARRRAAGPIARPGVRALSLADRLITQFDLAWTGEYKDMITGEFTERTIAAIRAFQRNRKFKETGVLNTQERAVLAALAKAKQAQVGWSMVDDAVTGARLGLPTRQVPIKSQSKSGSRWSSTQGQVQIETFKLREPGTTLAKVYEQQKKGPATRKLDVNVLRSDSFILSGTQGPKNFYVRAALKDGEVRGMTILYDPATEPVMDQVAVVMSSTFVPFPAAVATVAQQAAPQPRRKVEYGTGIIVSTSGHILTDRELTDGCDVVVVSGYGDATRQAEDRSVGLALLRVYGAADLAPAAFTGDIAKGPDLTLVGIADPQAQGGGGAVSTAAVRLRGNAVDPAPQLGFSGGAALDAQSRFAGLVQLKAPVVAVAGSAEARPQATVVPALAIRAFLDGQRLASPGSASGPGQVGLEAAMASVVRVICVRK